MRLPSASKKQPRSHTKVPSRDKASSQLDPGDSLHACLLRIVEVNSTLLETCDCSRAVAVTAAVAEFARMQIN